MLIDLHTHTYPKSDDSFVAVDDLLDAARAVGMHGVCLTEHDDFWPLESAVELSKRHGILVLPGAEINTDAGHVLVFGLHRYRFGMHKPAFLRAEADSLGAVMVAAHPYRRRYLSEPGQDPTARAEMLARALSDSDLRLFDAVESQNGRGGDDENLFAVDLRRALQLPGTGGSDAHRLHQLGTAATLFHRPVTSLDEFVREVKAGRMEPVDLTATSARPPISVH